MQKYSARLLFISAVALTFFGIIMVGNASVVTAAKVFNDQWYFVKLQGALGLFGLLGCLLAAKIPLAKLEKIATPFFILSLILLVVVLIPGVGSKLLGARRWINLGFFSFQPSEIAKLALCIYLAKLFKSPPNFLQLAVVLGVLGLLIMAQPDMGTFLVLFSIAIGTYLGSGGKISPLIISLPVVGCLAGLLIIISPYRASRLKTYLDMSHDPLGSSYQVRQSLIGLGTGGLTGSGLGQSRQKFDFLPEATTDSIFAVVGEELGFFGAVTIISIFAAIGLISLSVAQQQKNKFAQNLMIGLTVWLMVQAFINISATVALVPFTGIPLTFISYGRTALLSSLFAMGIMIHIARQTK